MHHSFAIEKVGTAMWSTDKLFYRTLLKNERIRLVSLRLTCLCTVVLSVTVRCTSIPTPQAETVRATVRLGGASFSSLEEGVEADIFVFDDDRRKRLDTYQRIPVVNGKIDAVATSGPKLIAVIINSRRDKSDWSHIDSWSALTGEHTYIIYESKGAPLLSGTIRSDGQHHQQCDLELTPILSRVVLRSILCDFTGKAYEGEKLKNARVYLTNVSAYCSILEESGASVVETINTAGLNPSDMALLNSPGLLESRLPSSIGITPVRTDTELFCYPNRCREETLGSRFTRLVIEGSIRGITYYWPIDINREDFAQVHGEAGVGRNTSYIYDIKITRTGSFDPDVPVSPADVEISCEVLPWVDMEETRELF